MQPLGTAISWDSPCIWFVVFLKTVLEIIRKHISDHYGFYIQEKNSEHIFN